MGLLTLQAIFCHHYPAYARPHPVPAHVRKAAHAIMRCRTAALGGHVQSCPDGHISRIGYNSCKHRSCLQCAFLQIERWLATHTARLLDCEHFHVILTIPHDLNPVWLANGALMTSLLFPAARDTLFTLLGDPKYLGAQPGIIAGLHTWGQTLVFHPHSHCVGTGGGLSPAGPWIAVRNGYLLPGRVVMAVLRGTLLDVLRRAWSRGTLQPPPGMRPQPFLTLLNRLGHKKKTRWNVRMMARYPHGHGVATSLARYLRGGPLKNSRLVAWGDKAVTCRYRDHQGRALAGKNPPTSMTLPPDEFIRRLLLHVPPPY